MKHIIALALALGFAVTGYAQTSATASQQSSSAATAQGTIQFSQSPADQHLSETVRNVSAPVLGAYAASFSQMNCGQTAQGGVAFAGVSIAGGASKDSHTCVLEVAAAESVRQSTVTDDPAVKAKLQDAATLIRCQVSPEVYKAYVAAGIDCKAQKPDGLAREDEQPANYRVAARN